MADNVGHGPQYGSFRYDKWYQMSGVAEEKRSFSNKVKFYCCSTLAIISATFVLCIASISLSSSQKEIFIASNSKSKLAGETLPSLTFSLQRDQYKPLKFFDPSTTVTYPFLASYQAIVEPYRTMKLTAFVYTDDDKETIDLSQYRYTICPLKTTSMMEKKYFAEKDTLRRSSKTVKVATKKAKAAKTTAAGSSSSDDNCQSSIGGEADTGILYECTPYTTYSLTVIQISTNQEVSSTTALCLYVRREIRDLTTEDLSGYITALWQLYSLPNEAGKLKYGEGFENITYILKHHSYNSMQRNADHLHEGIGFVMQHMKLNTLVDYAVQYIDPRESLPYWDYTMDSVMHGHHSEKSPMLQAATFGASKVKTDYTTAFTYEKDTILEGRIQSSYWQEYQVETNDFPEEFQSGYGYRRSPWDYNPSPYVSRFVNQILNTTFSPCGTHYNSLYLDTQMSYFMFEISNAGHAETHFVLGGLMGCDLLHWFSAEGYTDTEENLGWLCYQWGFFMKYLYRNNILARTMCPSLPTNQDPLTINYDDISCPYQCTTQNITYLYDLVPYWVSDFYNNTDGLLPEKLYNFICGGLASKIYLGDSLESSAPADPTFWMIHPTVERLFQAKLAVSGFEDESWPVETIKGLICTSSYCYSEKTQTFDYHAECCYGHRPADRMYDGVMASTEHLVGPTNIESLQSSDPRNITGYSLPYIYDSFTWDHCSDIGYNINALLAGFYEDEQEEVTTGKKGTRAKTLGKEVMESPAMQAYLAERGGPTNMKKQMPMTSAEKMQEVEDHRRQVQAARKKAEVN